MLQLRRLKCRMFLDGARLPANATQSTCLPLFFRKFSIIRRTASVISLPQSEPFWEILVDGVSATQGLSGLCVACDRSVQRVTALLGAEEEVT